MAQINMPTKRQEKDPLDTILKGLSIASSVYGIKEGREKAELLQQQRAQESDAAKFSQAAKEAELAEKGFQKQTDEDGGVFFARPSDYKNLADKKTEADIAKTLAETERIKYGRGTGDPEMADLRKLILQQQLAEAQRKSALEAEKQAPEGRLKNLPSTDKQRLDNAKLGLVSVQGMAAAISQGQNTFSLFGDNDFTQQRTLFEEALGRMQSGGAISKEEEMRFKNMAPTWKDSPEIQQKKLIQLQAEMASRLGTLGFTPEQVGVNLTEISPKQQARGLFNQEANAATPTGGITPEEAQAELLRRRGINKARLPGK